MIETRLRALPGALFMVVLLVLPMAVSAQDETVCIQCHAGQPEYLSAPIEQWRGSIHAENGISCQHCHGGDPTDFAMAMSPERGFVGVPGEEEIPGFCGKCHVGVEQDYRESAHGQALGFGGPQCVTCHGSHSVARASLDLINREDCSRCHEYGRASDIKDALASTDARIAELNRELARLGKLGFDVEELEGQVFAVRNDFHRLFHTVEIERVKRQVDEFTARLQSINNDIKTIENEIASRKKWGGAVVLLLVLAGVISLLLHKAYRKDE